MTPSSPLSSRRGSVLVVALLLAAGIAIALSSYLRLASTAATVSQRGFLANDSMNLAETGLEHMLWACNKASAAANAGNPSDAVWTGNGWTIAGTDAAKTFDSSLFTLSQNARGAVKVYVENYNSTGVPAPVAVAKSIITPARGAPVVKMIRVTLTRSSFFSTGMVAKDGITFSGSNASVDSWNSNPNNVTPSPNYAYNSASGPRRSNGSIATLNVSATASVQNAKIFGYVSVGSSDASAITLGSQGVISGDFNAPTPTRDDSRITTNFTENVPDATVPNTYAEYTSVTQTTGTIKTIPWITYRQGNDYTITGAGNCQLPDNGDLNKGVTTKVTNSDGTASLKTVYYYKTQAINLTGNSSNTLTIKPGYNVVICVQPVGGDGAGLTLVQTAGSAGIVMGTNATLALYTAANVDITGNSSTGANGGVVNPNPPSSFQVWGTGTAAQSQQVKISGNGSLSGVVYAPNATVTQVGNGEVFGAMVGRSIRVTGNANFHYDEALANFGGSNPFKINKWEEIVRQADRDTYTQVNGSANTF